MELKELLPSSRFGEETEALSRTVLTVTQITQNIKALLEGAFPAVWVTGEISNLRMPSSGHVYFTLKDEVSQIRAVMWRSNHRQLKFALQDGVQVLVRGSVTVYEARGDYQIVCDYVEPRGKGALQLAFEQLKERLEKEGLFDPGRKRPIPLLPKKIGIVTSPTGAAIRDILTVIESRFADVHIIIYPVKVQGEEAPGEICEGITYLNGLEDVDVIIVGRGGGSIEDLWAFNDEKVARAIFASRVPVISAVGHEIDFTIADFVADLRAPTPTAAALLVVQNKQDLEERVQLLRARMTRAVGHVLETARGDLKAARAALVSPAGMIRQYDQRVDEMSLRLASRMLFALKERRSRVERAVGELGLVIPLRGVRERRSTLGDRTLRLLTAVRANVERQQREVVRLVGLLESLSPLAVLRRGYSITLTLPEERVITESSLLSPGDRVRLRFHRGGARCQVEEVIPEGEDQTDG